MKTILVAAALILSTVAFFNFYPSDTIKENRESFSGNIQDQPSLEKPKIIKLHVGKEFFFSYEMSGHSEINFSALGKAMQQKTTNHNNQNLESYIVVNKGQLGVKVLEASSTGYLLTGSLQVQQKTTNGKSLAVSSGLNYPFSFFVASSGAISSFSFVKGLSEEDKMLIKKIVHFFDISLPNKSLKRWEAKAKDSNGIYLSQYSLKRGWKDPVKILKRKKKYESFVTKDSFAFMRSSTYKIKFSESIYELNLNQQWIKSIESKEDLIALIKNKKWNESSITFKAKRIKLHKIEFPEDSVALEKKLLSDQYLKSTFYQSNSANNSKDKKINLKAALDKYKNNTTKSKRENERKFLDFLRSHPQAVFKLIDYLNEQEANPNSPDYQKRHNQNLILWRLLAETGHQEAQEALLISMENNLFQHKTREMALAVVFDLAYPSEKTANRLIAFNHTMKNAEPILNNKMYPASMYAIGALGFADKQSPVVAKILSDHLTDSLTSTYEPIDKMIVLDAMANHGGEVLLDALAKSMIDDNPKIRAKAFMALRRMNNSAAEKVLMDYYEKESSVIVKRAALIAIQNWSPSKNMIIWCKNLFDVSTKEFELLFLISFLAKTIKKDSSIEPLFRNHLKKTSSVKIKHMIYKYIKP
ncbi:MAG: hypothetical protein COA79_17265 [Planctomycetota bacterium]|nr:MAG: hypothetical protein COA79_17265 [Planctomycetota bacterium]